MKATEFIDKLADDQIVHAIQQAEQKTSGEIRVFITHKPVEDPVLAAQRHFTRLKMDRTAQRNAVLIFVAPVSSKFAIVGDSGVHARCGADFWTDVATKMTEHFKRGDWTTGIVSAIQNAGALLGQHFPRSENDVDELPNKIERD